MKRYQVYLNPQSVKTLDTFQREVKLSRSRIISLAVDSLARNLAIALPPSEKPKKGSLDALVGLLRVPGKKTTNIALTVDGIYPGD